MLELAAERPLDHEARELLHAYGDPVVEPSRLLEGRQLLIRVLQHARPKSLRVVLISSLADFADAIVTHPALVLAKVHTVAVQGGLERDPSSPSGWRADSSVNNLIDLAAADAVYAFCFAHNIRLTVVSRHAVPLLPTDTLARSFAESTDCPAMRFSPTRSSSASSGSGRSSALAYSLRAAQSRYAAASRQLPAGVGLGARAPASRCGEPVVGRERAALRPSPQPRQP
jgi:hypothetical protein